MDVTLLLNVLNTAKDYILLGIFVVGSINGSARGAIATVSEMGQAGVKLTNEEALQKASDIMGKYLPFIPDTAVLPIRKWLIQKAFDSMKKKAQELLPKKN